MACFSNPRLAILAKDRGLALKSPTPGVVACPPRDPSSEAVDTESDVLSLGRFSSVVVKLEFPAPAGGGFTVAF